MIIRIKIVLYFILYALSKGIKPWRFFQVNAKYFNEEKKIFSKYEIEENIPSKWKLKNYILDNKNNPKIWEKYILYNYKFPLFLKPEWGQNSYGIYRVDKEKELNKYLKKIKNQNTTYICQELASYKWEYEILYIKKKHADTENLIFSATQTIDSSWEKNSIQWIHNNSKYIEITNNFTQEEIKIINDKIKKISKFNFARIWLKADNIKWIIDWNFKIFEINIFLPLPLNLLDNNISEKKKNIFLKKFVKALAIITREVSNKKPKQIFWNMIKKHYNIKK